MTPQLEWLGPPLAALQAWTAVRVTEQLVAVVAAVAAVAAVALWWELDTSL